jgi:hypothetical protein
LRLRSADPAAPCDETLERCVVAYRRALWRGRLRRQGFARTNKWRASLPVPADVAREAAACRTFGAAWERIEHASPALARRALVPAQLPRQIELATRLRARLFARQDVEPILRSPLAADEFSEPL